MYIQFACMLQDCCQNRLPCLLPLQAEEDIESKPTLTCIVGPFTPNLGKTSPAWDMGVGSRR